MVSAPPVTRMKPSSNCPSPCPSMSARNFPAPRLVSFTAAASTVLGELFHSVADILEVTMRSMLPGVLLVLAAVDASAQATWVVEATPILDIPAASKDGAVVFSYAAAECAFVMADC